MKGWWDYAIADELHQLAQETAQGNNLGVLKRCAHKLIGLTGTVMGGCRRPVQPLLPHGAAANGN
jgi:hypothetical protein